MNKKKRPSLLYSFPVLVTLTESKYRRAYVKSEGFAVSTTLARVHNSATESTD